MLNNSAIAKPRSAEFQSVMKLNYQSVYQAFFERIFNALYN